MFLTEEQEQLRKEVRAFAEREVAPHVMEWDEKSEFPHAVVKKLGEMGLLGVIFPEELGGSGMGYVEYVLAIEELSRVDGSVGIIVAAHNSLCTNHIMIAGNDEQRKRWVPKLASGEWLGAWGLTEPGSGSDAGGARTTAVKRGDKWVLNGTKTFITNGTYADCVVVLAVTDKEKGASGGITAFVVEKGAAGFALGKKEDKLGIRASSTCELIFRDCVMPGSQVLGEPGKGYKIAIETLNEGRIGIGAQMLGLAEGAWGHAARWAKERKQFGKALVEFQAMQFQLAEMATEIEGARLMVYNAARLKDAGLEFLKEAAMCKYVASQVAERVASLAVEVFGGSGFVKDYPVEKLYRDAKIGKIYEGTSFMQLATIAKLVL